MGEAETYFDDIQVEIIKKLRLADTSIKVAVAWFTDAEIINELSTIIQKGVDVEIIVSDNENNRQVDYSAITDLGCKLHYYPLKGYGSMHHKFCIIDKQFVITGSYNWTVNAKKNNGENIHISSDLVTIDKFIDKFNRLKNEAQGIENEDKFEGENKSEIEIKTEKIEEDFEEEWNIYLNSNVLNYNKEELFTQGKTAAENTHGNPDVVDNKMSMIYQSLLEDTEVDKKEIDKLKGRLENKIDNYKSINNQEAEEKKSTVELSIEAKRKTLNQQNHTSNEEIEKLENNKKNIEEVKIPREKEKIENFREEIENSKIEITPKPLRRRVWLEVFMLFLLTLYLFGFYSSVLYTILYGREDAMEFMSLYGKLPEMEVFNSQALEMAVERGAMTVLFISFFTILPVVFGFLFHSLKSKKVARWAYLLAAIILDGLLAYLIAKNVYMIDYQAGRETEMWEAVKAFSIARFWVVLLLGAVPYLAWGALYEHISEQLDNASRSVNHLRVKKTIELNKNKIEESRHTIDELKEETSKIKNEIIDENSKIAKNNDEINHLDYESKLKIDRISQDLNIIERKLDNQREKVMAYLDKDQIPVSKSSFKERVNTFMNGWEQWLYSFYNIDIADKKLLAAQGNVEQWILNTFKNAK